MRRYQRGVIVAFLGLLATTFVKFLGVDSPQNKQGGWTRLSPPDFND
ncbi:MAG TPA: hypothetical protein PKB15_04555 [Acidimicrobiia bacterium]|nr:hypothetical protein [Acidimicrobiia bacterium]